MGLFRNGFKVRPSFVYEIAAADTAAMFFCLLVFS